VLADTSGEDDAIEPAQRRGEGCDLPCDAQGEEVHRLAGFRSVARDQVATVRADAGDAKHARAMIEHVLDRIDR